MTLFDHETYFDVTTALRVATYTLEMPEETLARKGFKAFFDRRESEIFDPIERAEMVAEAGEQERRRRCEGQARKSIESRAC